MKAKKRKLNFMNMKTESWGKGTEKTSEEIDKILYGDFISRKPKKKTP